MCDTMQSREFKSEMPPQLVTASCCYFECGQARTAASEYLVGTGKLFVTADTVDEGVEIVKGSDVSEGSGMAVSDLCPSPCWRSSRRGIGLC